MDYSNPFLLRVRFFLGRKLKVLRPIVRLVRRLQGYNYEAAFDTALIKCISASDTVWDVGANEGYYTAKFSNKVASGTVVAFEPSPRTFALLQKKFEQFPNVRLENVALADRNGEASFFVSDSSVEDSLFNRAASTNTEVKVRTARGDSWVSHFPPNVIKIDVEGFELDVLKGMEDVLVSPQMRHVFIEVHFSILADRGQPGAPKEIVQRLERTGFSVEWLGPSHLVGHRK